MRRIFQMFCMVVVMIVLVPGVITAVFITVTDSPVVDAPPDGAAYSGIEEYVIGVVAAEMPALFNEEALKAQAVAARTYAIRHSGEGTEIGQAYITVEEMRKRWGDSFDEYYGKIRQAVMQTEGEIIVYEEEPIEAVFHALSAGITENSGDVWTNQLPYLQSVDSSFDETSPGFLAEKSFTAQETVDIINGAYPEAALSVNDLPNGLRVESHTPTGYVRDVAAGATMLEAGVVRSLFLLRSTNFTITYKDGFVIFTTKGYGHGAGLSQYGANYLADMGYGYRDIIQYYYKGVSLSNGENISSQTFSKPD